MKVVYWCRSCRESVEVEKDCGHNAPERFIAGVATTVAKERKKELRRIAVKWDFDGDAYAITLLDPKRNKVSGGLPYDEDLLQAPNRAGLVRTATVDLLNQLPPG